jgi:sugar phosphate isomerase/epimerase
MDYKRRQFLKLSGSLASGLALTSITNPLIGCNSSSRVDGNIPNFGLQLYTLRDIIPADPKNVLRQVSSFGYKQIESYEHDKLGMFWGMKNTEFKSYMDELGMQIVSSHANINKDFERKADAAAAIGMKYLICPWLGPQKTLDAFKDFASTFNNCGEICRQRGLRFAYHNHDYSFKQIDGQYPQDVLMQNTDTALVDYELDMYWVVTAGQDPAAWFKKYPGRFTLGHVKDRKGNTTATLGTGLIDYPMVLEAAKKAGMEYFIVEQEHYKGSTPMAAVEANATYMKKLKV